MTIISMVCAWCEEPILPGDQLSSATITSITPEGVVKQRWHYECAMRSVIGGLNHVLGRCTCCRGERVGLPPDPEHLTRREAALAAFRMFNMIHEIDDQHETSH